MIAARLPKPGEVWRLKADRDMTAEIVNVYPDALVYLYDHGDNEPTTCVDIPEKFVNRYNPPEPTVLSSKWLLPIPADRTRFVTYDVKPGASATHRLDLLSDGTFRVVEL